MCMLSEMFIFFKINRKKRIYSEWDAEMKDFYFPFGRFTGFVFFN